MRIAMDEAGRGPLFGPLYIGLVVSNVSSTTLQKHDLFQDSKSLTIAKRNQAFSEILDLEEKGKILSSIGSVDAQCIDKYGVTRAINLAVCRGLYTLFSSFMKKSNNQNFSIKKLKNLIREYEYTTGDKVELIIDGKIDFGLGKELDVSTITIIHGDAEVVEIAMASILAKVSRDAFLDVFALQYPHYGFEKHKGYGTKAHYQAIETYGVLPEHRKLFLKKIFPDRKIQKRDEKEY